VDSLSAQTLGVKKAGPKDAKDAGKDNYIGMMKLALITPKGKGKYVSDLQQAESRDPHVRWSTLSMRDNVRGQEYQVRIDIARQGPKKYDTQLHVPPPLFNIKGPGAEAAKEAKDAKDPQPDPNAVEDDP
jgi:hypothetical protein